MAESLQPVDVSSLVGPFTGGELLAAIARHPLLIYEGGLPLEQDATFDVRTLRRPGLQPYVLTYARQPDGRWLLECGVSGLEHRR
jgi:hypothetical protein